MVVSADDGEHVSMLAYRGFGQKLITRETALELAKALLKNAFGPDELERQGQLTAVEIEEGWWLVAGSPARRSGGEAYEMAPSGPVEIEISQFNCRIRKLTFN